MGIIRRGEAADTAEYRLAEKSRHRLINRTNVQALLLFGLSGENFETDPDVAGI